jgi:large subunit ribosomal protein L3
LGAFFVSDTEYMKFMLGTKQNMTTIFAEDGTAHAATILTAGPLVVTQVKTPETDGYKAVQVGYGELDAKRANKPEAGHGKGKAYRVSREFRDVEGAEVGQTIDISTFAVGDIIEVSAHTKGKGFQGGVKRHGFSGGPRTHGQKHSEREPGSIGGGGRAGGRVVKGMRMAGRMGGNRITVKNLKVLQVLPESNELVVRGAIPGRRGTIVEITA